MLTYNFDHPHAAEYLYDGNEVLLETTISWVSNADGNTGLYDGHAPATVLTPPTAPGFLFDEFYLELDGSYTHFGPHLRQNTEYPLLRNIIFLPDDYVYTIDPGVGYPKRGFVYSAVGPVELVTPLLPLLKGPAIYNTSSSINVGSPADDGTGNIYDDTGNSTGLKVNYFQIFLDSSSSYFLSKTPLYSADGVYVHMNSTERFIKTIVNINDKLYWCSLEYVYKGLYKINTTEEVERAYPEVKNKYFNKVLIV